VSAKRPRRSRGREPTRHPARPRRIHDESIVDAYGPEEQALGWYYYLERALHFPFPARSPLRPGELVIVTGMAPDEECEHEMFLQVRWQDRALAVPLAQLEVRAVRHVEAETREAVGDWHDWLDQGYVF
jgi:hypothetical protein